MSLPILQQPSVRSSDQRLRAFYRTELHWTQHLAEQVDLDAGSVFSNPELSRRAAANRVLAASLPTAVTIDDLIARVDAHFAGQGTRCLQWMMDPAGATSAVQPIVDRLKADGYVLSALPVLQLSVAAASVRLAEAGGLTIIPARASYRHAQLLADAVAREADEPQCAIERMLHLEDPHCDGLLALRGGEVVGGVDVLTVGDVGRIDQLFVVPAARRQGIGRTLLSRAIEICARAAFRDVVMGLSAGGVAYERLAASAGFEEVGRATLLNR